jgi:hypothetical protein
LVADDAGHRWVGWRWRAPWQWLPTVVSQPQIVCGDKPWDAPKARFAGFPFRVDEKRLQANFDLQLTGAGTYNLAFTMWAVSALPANRARISHEIMVWSAHSGQAPAGNKIASVNVNHVDYDLYVEPQHGDAAGRESIRWSYVAFVPAGPVLAGRFDMSGYLDALVARGLLPKTSYVTSLELGDEVCEGTGLARLQTFEVTMTDR